MNDLIREGCVLLLVLTLVPLVVTGAVGLVVSVLQASMQLQEQTISFLMRIVSCALVLVIMKSIMMSGAIAYMHKCFELGRLGR